MLAISYEPAAAAPGTARTSSSSRCGPGTPSATRTPDLFALEQRSYAHRPNKGGNDWSMDAIDAARLQNPAEVRADLISHHRGPPGLPERLRRPRQHRRLPALHRAGVRRRHRGRRGAGAGLRRHHPLRAGLAGRLGRRRQRLHPGQDKVDVQVQDGQLVTAAIEAGSTGTLRVKNPWPGQPLEVVDGKNGRIVVAPAPAGPPERPGEDGQVLPGAAGRRAHHRPAVRGGRPAPRPTAARHLGRVQIGLDTTPPGPAPRPSAPCSAAPTGPTA